MRYTRVPANVASTLQLNAGVLLSDFDPDTGTLADGNILGATTGGISFQAAPAYSDFGEDIDNCPKNTMELKRLEAWDIRLSGTFLSVSGDLARRLTAAADAQTDGSGVTSVTPRPDLTTADFSDIWWVGDYSRGDNGGFLAIHMENALSTGGFQLKSADRAKGNFSFEFTAHMSLADQESVPFELYIREGSGV